MFVYTVVNLLSVIHLVAVADSRSASKVVECLCDFEYRTRYASPRIDEELSNDQASFGRRLFGNRSLSDAHSSTFPEVHRLPWIPNYISTSSESSRYTLLDTFSKMDRRRADSPAMENILRRAAWKEDNCKSFRRIVGGLQVETPEQLPYMVFLDTGCGGSIIGEKWVLTANHCVNHLGGPYFVYVGALRTWTGCRYRVVKAIKHPNFTPGTLHNDIALVKVCPSFVFSPAVKPIALATKKPRSRTCGVATGWGAKVYNGTPSDELMMAVIPVVSKHKCKMFAVKKGQFCAGYKRADMDACQGDSGGPFTIDGLLAGIISYGYQCAVPQVPGVYVSVVHHRKWIRKMIGHRKMNGHIGKQKSENMDSQ